MSARVLAAALAIQLLLGGAFVYAATQGFPFFGGDRHAQSRGRGPLIAPVPRLRRFDSRGAFALVRTQVGYGQRPAGSAALRRLGARLRPLLPHGRFEAVPAGLRNIAGVLPGRLPAIVIGAHYDTEAHPPGFVGANDGAAGTAAVIELARALARVKRPASAPELRFVLFDGEEEPLGSTDFLRDALRGSKAYARRHHDEVRALVLLDYIGNRRLSIPREGNSDMRLWNRLRAAARHAGVAAVFPDATGTALFDDHTPFIQRGIPAVDLIDFDYPERDTVRDTLDKVSPRSLDAVGETVAELVLGF